MTFSLNGFDPITAIASSIVTIVLAPLGIFILKKFGSFLKTTTGYLLDLVFYNLTAVINHAFAARSSLKKYCRLQLGAQSDYFHVPSSLDIQLPIDQVYIPLILEQQDQKRTELNQNNIFTAGNKLLITGDPGSGKSSLVKWIFRDACNKAIEAPKNSKLPILIELKNLKITNEIPDEKLGEWFFEKISKDVLMFEVYKIKECFESYLKTEGILLLLDGLDEVSSNQYPRMKLAINGLINKLTALSTSNYILLTMRTQFYKQIKEDYRESFCSPLTLKPFTPSDIYDFLTRWPFEEKESYKKVSEIYNSLTDTPTLRELCTNPLILSMYVAEHQASGTFESPESRTEFYEKVTNELISSRRAKQIGPPKVRNKIKEQRYRILGKLAYKHLIDIEQPSNSLNWSDAIKITKEVMNCNDSEAETNFDELSKETGMITEEKTRESFRFIHLSFCEFLCAYEANQELENGWLNILNTHEEFNKSPKLQHRTRLLEVIPFSFGLMQRKEQSNAISKISKSDDKRLIARCFLETKAYDHKSWLDFMKKSKDSLLNQSENTWDVDFFQFLHLFNIVLTDAKLTSKLADPKIQAYDPEEIFQSLINQNKENIHQLLSTYAAQDAIAAFRFAELSNLDVLNEYPEIIISNCDQAPFFALMKNKGMQQKTENEIINWASIFSEAALRSKVVSNWLVQEKPNLNWKNIESQLPQAKKWNADWLLQKHSLLLQCLSIFPLNRKITNNYKFLPLIRKIPCPGLFTKALDLRRKAIYLPITVLPILWGHSNQGINFLDGNFILNSISSVNFLDGNFILNSISIISFFYVYTSAIILILCRASLRYTYRYIMNYSHFPFDTSIEEHLNGRRSFLKISYPSFNWGSNFYAPFIEFYSIKKTLEVETEIPSSQKK